MDFIAGVLIGFAVMVTIALITVDTGRNRRDFD